MFVMNVVVENHKRLKCFKLDTKGKSVVIAGKPGEGKTTAISAIWEVLEASADPITHGEKKGRIKVTLGEPDQQYRVFAERIHRPSGDEIAITTSDGERISAPVFKQLFLNSFAKDPLALMSTKGNERVKLLLALAKFPEGSPSLEELNSTRISEESKRLDLGRDVKRYKARVGEEVPAVDPVDVMELNEKLHAAIEANSEVEKKRSAVADLERRIETGCGMIDSTKEEIRNIESARIEAIKRQKAALEEYIERTKRELDSFLINQDAKITKLKDNLFRYEQTKERLETELVEKKEETKSTSVCDVNKIAEQIQRAGLINSQAQKRKDWERARAELEATEMAFKTSQDTIEAIDAKKREILAAAQWPVEGLSIDDSGDVTYNGCLWDNLGTADQIVVSARLLAARLGKLRCCRIDRAESLSADQRKNLIEVLEGLGVQVLMARVSEESAVESTEIRIVDGVYADNVAQQGLEL